MSCPRSGGTNQGERRGVRLPQDGLQNTPSWTPDEGPPGLAAGGLAVASPASSCPLDQPFLKNVPWNMSAVEQTLILHARGELQTRDGGRCPLERKTAALLVYLATEGPTPRSRLAGLLWPESSEPTARSNLRQLLRRLRQGLPETAELVVGSEVLGLGPSLQLRPDAALLALYEYDDCPDLADWLAFARERALRDEVAQLRARAAALERAGQLSEAHDLVERVLDLDPVSEQAHRDAMRLLYLQGDRAAALSAYHRCQGVLQRELGVQPLPETVQLAREIDQAAAPTPLGPARPISVHRPPRLVGREQLWADLVGAGQGGVHLLLHGQPGVGKTRLLTDYAASRGQSCLLTGRPGDHVTPYSSVTRACRALLRAAGGEMLPAWAALELARVLPELGPNPGPIESVPDRLRFYRAFEELLRLTVRGGTCTLGLDDLQFMDDASLEVTGAALDDLLDEEQGDVCVVCAYRDGELSAVGAQLVAQPGIGRPGPVVRGDGAAARSF